MHFKQISGFVCKSTLLKLKKNLFYTKVEFGNRFISGGWSISGYVRSYKNVLSSLKFFQTSVLVVVLHTSALFELIVTSITSISSLRSSFLNPFPISPRSPLKLRNYFRAPYNVCHVVCGIQHASPVRPYPWNRSPWQRWQGQNRILSLLFPSFLPFHV